MEIDHEIILPLPLIQEVQLSVIGESMCTSTEFAVEDEACPGYIRVGELAGLT